MVQLPLSRPWGYALALAGVALATVMRLALDPVLGLHYPFVTYIIILLPTAWLCGLGPALFSIGLGLPTAYYLLIQPHVADPLAQAAYLTGLVLYVSVSLVGILILEVERRTRHRMETEAAQRRQAEERLRESEERFRVMADSSPIMIWVSDRDGNTLFVNRAYCEFFGVTWMQAAVSEWQPLIHPEDAPTYVGSFLASLRERRPWTCQARVRRADGHWRWLESHSLPRFSPSGEFLGSVGSSPDITEQKQCEQELRTIDRRKDEFLATLAHELRNPLAPIQNAVAVMELTGHEPGAIDWSRQVIKRQARHLARLVDDLFDLSRINRGKLTLVKAPLTVGSFLMNAVEACRPFIEKHRHQLDVDAAECEMQVDGDLTRLTQVTVNLLNNAAKYTPDGGRISLSVAREGDMAVIRVRDDGEGIPVEALPKVFDLFMQADRTLDRSEGGLGLGLPLVKHLVEMHDGTIEVVSDGPGRGSEFIVRLPLLRAEALSSSLDCPSEGPVGAPVRPRRILVVDDDRDSAESLVCILLRLGHEAQTAQDGPAAVEQAMIFAPEVVLLDIGLPGMDGHETAARLLASPALDGVFLAAMNDCDDADDRRRAEEAGFHAFLVKPVELSALNAILTGPGRVGASANGRRSAV